MDRNESTGGPFLKSGYYTGKLLHAADFIRDQKYVNDKLEFINRKFHGQGIAEGLEVRIMQDGSLKLTKGSAIDSHGRIIMVPEDRRIEPGEIEGLLPTAEKEFILGIRYAEQPVETERDCLEKGVRREPSVIAETCSFGAYKREEFLKLQNAAFLPEGILTKEKILYEQGAVRLAVHTPGIVPADSMFRIRVKVQAAQESNVSIGWQGTAKLQGAVFAQSGDSVLILREEQAVCRGTLQREYDICTEENRKLPVTLEISDLKVITGDGRTVDIPGCQFHIDTAVSYPQAVRNRLRRLPEQEQEGSWVPLACLKLEEAAFSLSEESNVRLMAVCSREEELLRSISEENGILDIRWRKLLKQIWSSVFPPCVPPEVRPPMPPEAPPFLRPEELLTEEQFWELTEADRESRTNRGVTVIPVPRRYRKGRVLLSEEIPHGFPGEEVLLRCARVWEEPSYAYWEKDRKRYKIIQGDEELFSDLYDGQKIVKKAVLQNVEEGTFRIALTLNKSSRRSRSKEVAISWTAVRSI